METNGRKDTGRRTDVRKLKGSGTDGRTDVHPRVLTQNIDTDGRTTTGSDAEHRHRWTYTDVQPQVLAHIIDTDRRTYRRTTTGSDAEHTD